MPIDYRSFKQAGAITVFQGCQHLSITHVQIRASVPDSNLGWRGKVCDLLLAGGRFESHRRNDCERIKQSYLVKFPDRPRGPHSLLYNGYWVFPGGRGGRGVVLTTHPHLECRGPGKSRAIPLLILRAFVDYKSVKTFLFGETRVPVTQHRLAWACRQPKLCLRLAPPPTSQMWLSSTFKIPHVLMPWCVIKHMTNCILACLYRTYFSDKSRA